MSRAAMVARTERLPVRTVGPGGRGRPESLGPGMRRGSSGRSRAPRARVACRPPTQRSARNFSAASVFLRELPDRVDVRRTGRARLSPSGRRAAARATDRRQPATRSASAVGRRRSRSRSSEPTPGEHELVVRGLAPAEHLVGPVRGVRRSAMNAHRLDRRRAVIAGALSSSGGTSRRRPSGRAGRGSSPAHSRGRSRAGSPPPSAPGPPRGRAPTSRATRRPRSRGRAARARGRDVRVGDAEVRAPSRVVGAQPAQLAVRADLALDRATIAPWSITWSS